jgi:ATP-dependent protease ClpP protease subunit/phage anti-repressor protein
MIKEINFYGEIIDAIPVNWWTGEEEKGNFIALDQFLESLEDLNSMSETDELIIHVNSPGGSVFSAISIRSRLQEIKAKKTVIYDGIVASAASFICIGIGAKIKMHKGAMVMIHNASAFLYGYYEKRDIERTLNMFEGIEQTISGLYEEKTGLSLEELLELQDKETWLTHDQALNYGFIDEIISDTVEVGISEDNIFSNGLKFSARIFNNYTNGLPILNKKIENKQKEVDEMGEILDILELKNTYPDFIKEIENESYKHGVSDERGRIKDIDEIANSIDSEFVIEAKYGEKPLSAKDLAFEAIKNKSNTTVTFNTAREIELNNKVNAIPNNGNADNTKKDIERLKNKFLENAGLKSEEKGE